MNDHCFLFSVISNSPIRLSLRATFLYARQETVRVWSGVILLSFQMDPSNYPLLHTYILDYSIKPTE